MESGLSSTVSVENAVEPRADLAPRDWLEIGQALLKSGGLRALKLRSLAQAAGASTGSFYHHFKDFDGYHAALASYFAEAQIDPLLASLTASDLAPVERRPARLDVIARIERRHPPEIAALLATLSRGRPDDVVDVPGVERVALGNRFQHGRGEVLRVHVRERALARFTDPARGTDGVDDQSLGHISLLLHPPLWCGRGA